MIFVTVGTHEQPFNRLIKEIDNLKQKGIIKEEVIIQTGFSTYEPRYCKWEKIFPYEKMLEYVREARIVITHGGPASFIMALQEGKIPIVVPRQKKFNEHINDHQLEFCTYVAENMKNIILICDIEKLENTIVNYREDENAKFTMNNAKFNNQFEEIVKGLFE